MATLLDNALAIIQQQDVTIKRLNNEVETGLEFFGDLQCDFDELQTKFYALEDDYAAHI